MYVRPTRHQRDEDARRGDLLLHGVTAVINDDVEGSVFRQPPSRKAASVWSPSSTWCLTEATSAATGSTSSPQESRPPQGTRAAGPSPRPGRPRSRGLGRRCPDSAPGSAGRRRSSAATCPGPGHPSWPGTPRRVGCATAGPGRPRRRRLPGSTRSAGACWPRGNAERRRALWRSRRGRRSARGSLSGHPGPTRQGVRLPDREDCALGRTSDDHVQDRTEVGVTEHLTPPTQQIGGCCRCGPTSPAC